MRNSKRKIILVTSLVLVLLVSIGATLAYFSDYDPHQGAGTLVLNGQTELNEDPTDNSKTISIKNTSVDEVDMVVRVRVIGPVEIAFAPGDGWVQNGDWWYYNKVLAKDESTSNLVASWEIPADSAIENFDVVVVHESAIAIYDGNTVTTPDGWDFLPTITAE